ncbi:MAG: DMT family transporter [Pseudomonadota bacterium]
MMDIEIKSDARVIRTALGFMIGASAFLAGTSIIAKALGIDWENTEGLHALQVSAGRFVFACSALWLFVAIQPQRRPSFQNIHWRWHLCRSLFGWIGVSAMFAAVAHMPVAEATTISFLSPVVTMGLAVLMLGEMLTLRKIVAAMMALLGAVLILRPGTDAFQMVGLFAVASAVFLGIEAIFIKRLSDREPALQILLINNSIGASVAGSIALFVWQWPSGGQWGLLVLLGLVMACAQAMFIQSMKRAEASLVIPAMYSILVFAAFYDFVLYEVVPDAIAALGALLVVSGAIVLARQAR